MFVGGGIRNFGCLWGCQPYSQNQFRVEVTKRTKIDKYDYKNNIYDAKNGYFYIVFAKPAALQQKILKF